MSSPLILSLAWKSAREARLRRATFPANVRIRSAGSTSRAARARFRLVVGPRFPSEGLGTLAAQLFQARTDRRKVVGSAWFGHVSSLQLGRASTRLEWFLSLVR